MADSSCTRKLTAACGFASARAIEITMFLGIEIGGTKLQFGVGAAEERKADGARSGPTFARPTAPKASAGRSSKSPRR